KAFMIGTVQLCVCHAAMRSGQGCVSLGHYPDTRARVCRGCPLAASRARQLASVAADCDPALLLPAAQFLDFAAHTLRHALQAVHGLGTRKAVGLPSLVRTMRPPAPAPMP